MISAALRSVSPSCVLVRARASIYLRLAHLQQRSCLRRAVSVPLASSFTLVPLRLPTSRLPAITLASSSGCLDISKQKSPSRILLIRARSYSRIFVFCFRPVRARSRSCLRRVVPLPPSVRALVSSSAGGPFARIRALASPSPSGMHVYPSVCGPLARNRALASLSGNGVFRENSPAIERTAVWSAI